MKTGLYKTMPDKKGRSQARGLLLSGLPGLHVSQAGPNVYALKNEGHDGVVPLDVRDVWLGLRSGSGRRRKRAGYSAPCGLRRFH